MIPPKAVEKLAKRIRKLCEWRYAVVAEVPLDAAETMEHLRTPPEDLAYKAAPIGSKWGKHWGTVWFRGSLDVPKTCRGRRLYYRMQSGHEKLLFVDGLPFAGMDAVHHTEVLLLAYARGGEHFDLHVEGYSGHPVAHVDPYSNAPITMHCIADCGHEDPPLALERSEALVEREAVCGLYYDAEALYRTALILGTDSRRRAVLLDHLNAALDLVPVHWGSEEELDAAAKAARKLLTPLLKHRNGPSMPAVALAGHAHIDVGWFWPVKESIRKCARTFSTVLNLMNDYPDLRFIQSQPVLYQMTDEHYPDLMPKIKKRVKEGRWEPNGGMWVEADCNVTSGESLVRQFLEGRKKSMELYGYKADTLWLPDVFGYSAALPQILKGCDIENFVTSKINWNDTNIFPYTTFWWQGIDGSRVFTHFITTRQGGYGAQVYPEVLDETWRYVQQKEVQESTLAGVGISDGGGGPTREMCEMACRLKDLEGCPKGEFVNVSQYLKGLREQDLRRPTWVGELYLELHRGTYTSQSRTKRYNRQLELLLREVELYSILAVSCGFEYPSRELERNWRVLLTNQFHDILPGTSSRRVYEVAEAEYGQMVKDLTVLRDAALRKLGEECVPDSEGHAYLLANALAWHRDEIVVLPEPDFSSAVDAQGNALPCQSIEGGLAVKAPAASLGVAPIALRKKRRKSASPFSCNTKTLESPHYRVAFDKAGKIVSLYDKAAEREIVQEGRRLNDFYTAEDVPVQWDAWDIDLDYRSKCQAEDRLLSREVVADGPLFLTLRSRYSLGRGSELTQDIVFYADSRRIDFKTVVEWQERHLLLKTGFAFDLSAETCRSEIQFGHVVRPTHTNTSWEQARFEVCAHKWVDMSEGEYGVALLNDGKYGYDTLDRMVSLTLLRSPGGPDAEADQGRHEFTYALLPHQGNFSAEVVVREAYALNVPITALRAPGVGKAQCVELCSVSNPNVVIETIKKAEQDDALVLRLYEAGGTQGAATVNFSRPPRKAVECSLLEEHEQAVRVKNQSISFAIRPFAIKTFKIYF